MFRNNAKKMLKTISKVKVIQIQNDWRYTTSRLYSTINVLYKQQQLSACHHDANMRYQAYSSSFFYVNMDAFDCCTHISLNLLERGMRSGSSVFILYHYSISLYFYCLWWFISSLFLSLQVHTCLFCNPPCSISVDLLAWKCHVIWWSQVPFWKSHSMRGPTACSVTLAMASGSRQQLQSH